jgi:2-polyprenyl-3-methyl-5-hydroxy-6-metoxy-1,4-benzoquinol methylase
MQQVTFFSKMVDRYQKPLILHPRVKQFNFMDHQNETLRTWNKIATMYEEKFMHLDLYNDSYNYLLECLNKANASVMDVGCGPGNITQYLLTKRSDLKVLGIDASENMIELARKNNPSADFITMDCREIDRLNKKFDAIVCGFCIPYLSDHDCIKLISDCQNLLNDSGILYLSFVDGQYENSGFITGSTGDRTYFYYHPLDNMVQIFKAHPWDIERMMSVNYIKSDGTNDIHSIIISKKQSCSQR